MCLKFKDNYCVYTSHYQLPTKPIALDSLFLNLPSHCARSSCIASPQKRPPAPSQACFYCPIILQSLLLRIRAWSRIILPLQLLRTVVKFSLSRNFTKLSTLSTFQNFSCPLPCQFWYLDYLLKPPPRVSLCKLAHSNSSESGPSCFTPSFAHTDTPTSTTPFCSLLIQYQSSNYFCRNASSSRYHVRVCPVPTSTPWTVYFETLLRVNSTIYPHKAVQQLTMTDLLGLFVTDTGTSHRCTGRTCSSQD